MRSSLRKVWRKVERAGRRNPGPQPPIVGEGEERGGVTGKLCEGGGKRVHYTKNCNFLTIFYAIAVDFNPT